MTLTRCKRLVFLEKVVWPTHKSQTRCGLANSPKDLCPPHPAPHTHPLYNLLHSASRFCANEQPSPTLCTPAQHSKTSHNPYSLNNLLQPSMNPLLTVGNPLNHLPSFTTHIMPLGKITSNPTPNRWPEKGQEEDRDGVAENDTHVCW